VETAVAVAGREGTTMCVETAVAVGATRSVGGWRTTEGTTTVAENAAATTTAGAEQHGSEAAGSRVAGAEMPN
jgi:hypothetical protein